MENTILINIGQKIQELRKSRNLSQEQFAEAIGASRDYISDLEHGEVNPRILLLYKIAEMYDCPVSYFIEEEDSRFDRIYHMKPESKLILLEFMDSIIGNGN